jgi:hypothetical protein
MNGNRSVSTVDLGNGMTVLVETDASLATDRLEGALPRDVIRMIEEVGRAAKAAAQALAPDTFSLEFGVEVGGEAGIPFITKGTAAANFTVSLEWSKDSAAGAGASQSS